MHRMRSLFAAGALLSACELDPGEACEITGDGFTRQDPCEFTCVEWEVTCDDGSTTTPDVCSAGPCSSNADCPADYDCITVGIESECLPDTVCASTPQP